MPTVDLADQAAALVVQVALAVQVRQDKATLVATDMQMEATLPEEEAEERAKQGQMVLARVAAKVVTALTGCHLELTMLAALVAWKKMEQSLLAQAVSAVAAQVVEATQAVQLLALLILEVVAVAVRQRAAVPALSLSGIQIAIERRHLQQDLRLTRYPAAIVITHSLAPAQLHGKD